MLEFKAEKDANFPTVPQSCSARWTMHKHAKVHCSKPLPLGDYDHNISELTTIYKALKWLENHRHDDSIFGGAHISTDNSLTCGRFTNARLHTKYYPFVQRARRRAAQLCDKFYIYLH